MKNNRIDIDNRQIALSNPDKVLYPAADFTKLQVVEYYQRIASYMLPHLQDRALTLKRYPDGVNEDSFFEKRCPGHRPPWLRTAEVSLEKDKPLTACLANDPSSLLWIANLAALELHVPLARVTSPQTPDSMVLDLDPGESADILSCARVAFMLRDLLERLGLESLVKTSGKKGLHLFVPLNRRQTTFEEIKTFSRTLALILGKEYPDLVTANISRDKRRGRVFINWAQNDDAKTMICAYSLRAEPQPTVSLPLTWKELERLAARTNPQAFHFSPDEAVRRTGETGDLFGALLTKQQKLPHV